MSSERAGAAKGAMQTNVDLAQKYYEQALPAMGLRLGTINAAYREGEPAYMKTAYDAERTSLSEGLLEQGRAAQSRSSLLGKSASLGGNAFGAFNPVDVGSRMANALYGSKFQEGQAGIDQSMNLLSLALGGAGTAGSGALGASGDALNAMRFMPNYNPAYASALGLGNLGMSIYGAFANQPSAAKINLTNFAAE